MATAEKGKQKKEIFYYAIYARKSTEEEDSRSIKNQIAVLNAEMQRLITNDKVNEYVNVETFIDEDYSGTDSERPDFKQLLKMIGLGKVNMLIVTDLSRLSRNIAESINYVQGLFVAMDVRFISTQLPTLDSYLQPEKIYSLEIPMQSMMNENHCAETSMKIRRTFDRLRKDGKFIGAFAAYGWKKDPGDKHRLLLDEEPYQIMNMMSEWLLSGETAGQIAKKLNEMGIANPSTYKKEHNLNHNSTKQDSKFWSSQTVRKLLSRPENVGDLIQGRAKIKSYKIHKAVKTSPDEWYISEGVIPAIFSKELHKKILTALSRSVRVSPENKAKEVYIFSGFLKCPDCGKSVVRKPCSKGGYVYYMCNTYKNYGSKGCTKHCIRHDRLEQAVLSSIQKQIDLFVNLKEVINEVDHAPLIQKQRFDYGKLLNKKNKELVAINSFKKSLYEDLKNDVITMQEYRMMKAEYTQQEEHLRQLIEKIQSDIKKVQSVCDRNNPYIESFVNYANVKTLSREILMELVESILVHEENRITIRFKFQDEYLKLIKSLEEASNSQDYKKSI